MDYDTLEAHPKLPEQIIKIRPVSFLTGLSVTASASCALHAEASATPSSGEGQSDDESCTDDTSGADMSDEAQPLLQQSEQRNDTR